MRLSISALNKGPRAVGSAATVPVAWHLNEGPTCDLPQVAASGFGPKMGCQRPKAKEKTKNKHEQAKAWWFSVSIINHSFWIILEDIYIYMYISLYISTFEPVRCYHQSFFLAWFQGDPRQRAGQPWPAIERYIAQGVHGEAPTW